MLPKPSSEPGCASGKTILTTVQKFQELQDTGEGGNRKGRAEYPLLSQASNIFVLADEAHRTPWLEQCARLEQGRIRQR